MRKLITALLILLWTASLTHAQDNNDGKLLEALRQGSAIGLMRHALAPGFGDPAEFKLGDCSTQRNLSDEGRAQAKAVGKRLRDAGVKDAKVMTSQWCRTTETAELLGLGPVSPMPALNSFYADRSQQDARTQATRDWLKNWKEQTPLVLVSHQVNIRALVGVSPASGEMIVLMRDEAGNYKVIGSLTPQ